MPFLVVTLLWFISTGLVAMMNHRRRQSFGRSMLIASICALSGLLLIAVTSQSTEMWAAYAAFVGGLLIWSWHEISFLTGAVVGSHRDPCPPQARGWQRFSMATMALIHHEIALVMTAGLLMALAAVTANPTGAYTFTLLLLFRLSSKLNIYWGVPNIITRAHGLFEKLFRTEAVKPHFANFDVGHIGFGDMVCRRRDCCTTNPFVGAGLVVMLPMPVGRA
jgi:putative photosynthetic complex assembly protein 2